MEESQLVDHAILVKLIEAGIHIFYVVTFVLISIDTDLLLFLLDVLAASTAVVNTRVEGST